MLIDAADTTTLFELLGLDETSRIGCLSPHPDDIALSCGATMHALGGINRTIVTCFSRSTYAPFAPTGCSTDVDTVTAIRKAEELAYCKRIGATNVDLQLDDVTLRYANEQDWLNATPQLTDLFDLLCQSFEKTFSEFRFTHLFCPLALGNHVDHVLVREAARYASGESVKIVYFEDFPYAERIGGPKLASKQAAEIALGTSPLLLIVGNFIDRKVDDLALYASQIFPDYFEGARRYAAGIQSPSHSIERFWI